MMGIIGRETSFDRAICGLRSSGIGIPPRVRAGQGATQQCCVCLKRVGRGKVGADGRPAGLDVPHTEGRAKEAREAAALVRLAVRCAALCCGPLSVSYSLPTHLPAAIARPRLTTAHTVASRPLSRSHSAQWKWCESHSCVGSHVGRARGAGTPTYDCGIWHHMI